MTVEDTPQLVLLCGPPRSGTTVACELLNHLPDVRALDEPLPVQKMIQAATTPRGLDVDALSTAISAFADAQRTSLSRDGTAMSKHVDGRVIGKKVSDELDENGQRRKLPTLGDLHMGVPVTPFTLVIKHPVAFSALAGTLGQRLPTAAVVRNPLAVLASWESVPMAVRDGRLSMPAVVAPELTATLEETDDRLERQLLLLDFLFAAIADGVAKDRICRYEDVIETGGRALAAVVPSAAALDVPLASRNRARIYDDAHLTAMAPRLLDRDGAYWDFYDRADVERLAAASPA